MTSFDDLSDSDRDKLAEKTQQESDARQREADQQAAEARESRANRKRRN